MDNSNVSVISFGIRNISLNEISFLKKNKKRIKIYWAKDKSRWNLGEFKKIIKNKKVYLTFDVDGFDSSLMPATGTPEPGGLFWNETIQIIKIAINIPTIKNLLKLKIISNDNNIVEVKILFLKFSDIKYFQNFF